MLSFLIYGFKQIKTESKQEISVGLLKPKQNVSSLNFSNLTKMASVSTDIGSIFFSRQTNKFKNMPIPSMI